MNKIEPTVKRKLPCQLTPEEKQERGKSLADLEYAKVEIERNKKIEMERFKDELTSTDLGIDKLVSVIRSGMEDREVDCEWKPDWTTMVKSLIRLDTNEPVQTMPISENERQTALPLDGETCSECPDDAVFRDSGGILYCGEHKSKAVGTVTEIAQPEEDDKKDTSHINRRRK